MEVLAIVSEITLLLLAVVLAFISIYSFVKRKDIVALFGVSMAQSSSDIQKYLELNPGAMNYDLSSKRYQATENMQCMLHQPLLEDGIRCFLPSSSISHIPVTIQTDQQKIATVILPTRMGKHQVEQMIIRSLLNTLTIKVQYWSVSSGKNTWRDLSPTSLGHDGYRWHARAWCHENEDYRDFVLSRISSVKKSTSSYPELPADKAWETIETVLLKPNSKLPENAKRAIEMDYGIRKNGTLKLKVRQAMREYLLAHMRVSELDLPNHFETIE